MQKARYELDPYNRLVVTGSGHKSGLNKFRKVMDGRFRTDGNNELSYHVKAPASKEDNIPSQLRIKGEWSLTGDHDLRLTLDKEARETFGDQITLKGEILEAGGNSLLFAVTTTTKDNTRSTYVLNLGGVWKADRFNRLSFHARREGGRYNILTLTGVWDIGRYHQMIYSYEKANLLRKKRKAHTLAFKGCWDIKNALRISYVLSGSTDSEFEFKTAAGIFKNGYIRYEVGIGLGRRTDPEMRIVTLSGRWNLKKNVGLVFDMDYADGSIKRMVFGAEAKFTGKDTVTFKLMGDAGNREIGAELELSRKILKGDGEAFLRALASRREASIYAGAAWQW